MYRQGTRMIEDTGGIPPPPPGNPPTFESPGFSQAHVTPFEWSCHGVQLDVVTEYKYWVFLLLPTVVC